MPWGRERKSKSSESEVLFDPLKVDLVTATADKAVVNLYIVADQPWTGSDRQLTSLQEKIHNYVSFALDGQLAAAYPEMASLPWCIVIDCQRGAPDERTAEVLDRTRSPIQDYGGDLTVGA